MKRVLSLILCFAMLLGATVVSINATDTANPFEDVKSGDWFYENVMEAYGLGLVKGESETKFSPKSNMTRAAMVTLVSRLAGVDLSEYEFTKKFKDVNEGDWYAAAVTWASDCEIVNGYEDRTFLPNKNISRQELAVMFVRLINYLDIYVPDDSSAGSFNDRSSIAKWAKTDVEQLRKTGLVKGDNAGNFNPTANASRAEVATLAVRLYPYICPSDTDVDYILDRYANGTCSTHNQYHVFCGYSASVTAETFASYILRWMGLDEYGDRYEVTVDEDDIATLLEGYSGEGTGNSTGADINVKLKDNLSGNETDWVTIRYYCTKYPDAAGDMDICPEDYDAMDYINNLDQYFDTDDAGRLKIALGAGSTFTRKNFSDIILTHLGLSTNAFEVIFSDDSKDDFDDQAAGFGGLGHSQVGAAEFNISIRRLAVTAMKGEIDESEYVDWAFWFSKDLHDYFYNNSLPDGSEIVFDGDVNDIDEVGTFLLEYAKENSGGVLNDFTGYILWDYNDTLNALETSDRATVNVSFVYYAEDFFNGNQAGFDDTIIDKTYTLVVAPR